MGGEEREVDRWGFHDMAYVIPEGESGDAKVKHRVISEREAAQSRTRQAATGGREQAVKAGKIAQLFVGNHMMMSDTPMERDTNKDFLDYARGHVLIAGLGLGVVLPPLLAQKFVKSVTVVEKSAGVIELVEPHVRTLLGSKAKKLTVVEGDIFTWRAPRGARYDTIYFDIWPSIHRDNLVEMRKLHTRYRRRKAKSYSWMSSWLFEELKEGWY
jgi:hypothetical protein